MLELLLALVPALQASEPDRLVLVRSGGNLLEDAPRFAQAMCASGIAGKPACLLVGAELDAGQRELIERLPPHELVVVGAVPDGLAGSAPRQVDSAFDLYAPSEHVVLTSQHIADILEAAPEAWRRGVPLVIASPGYEERLTQLGAHAAWVVAPRQPPDEPPGIAVRDLSDAGLRWRVIAKDEASPYLALVNAHPGRSWTTGAMLGATLLAARHRGCLLSIDEPVEFRYASLAKQREPPAGLEQVDVRRWITGTFELDGTSTSVAVPQVGTGQAVMGSVRKYGDPVVDLNGDGVLSPGTETIGLGEVRTLAGRERSFSVRLIGALRSTKFRDGLTTNRAVAVSPPAEVVAARLTELYGGEALPAALLIAGDHREIPFDYVRDPVYAATIMHEQELASDNLFADPDRDGYLDLPVGRFVSTSAIGATTLALRMACREDLRGLPSAQATLIYPAWPEDELERGMLSIFASFEALLLGLELDLEAAGLETHARLRKSGGLADVLPHLGSSSLILFAHHSGPDTWTFRIHSEGEQRKVEQLITRARIAEGREGEPLPFLHGAPLVVGAGCDSAGLDYEVAFEDSIVHAFFEAGAVAYLGNTRAGIPDTEEFLVRHTLQGVLGALPHPRGALTLGEAFRRGKNLLGFLIEQRGPFRSIEPFADHALSMRREWSSLVLYGDPLQRLGAGAGGAGLAPRVSTSSGEGARIEVLLEGELTAHPVWIMEQPGVGPLAEITSLTAPGLGYSSVPWATWTDSNAPATVGPGLFLDLAWPAGAERLVLAEGPDWSLGAWRRVRDVRGGDRLQVSIDLVRYAMGNPESAQVARRVVLAFE